MTAAKKPSIQATAARMRRCAPASVVSATSISFLPAAALPNSVQSASTAARQKRGMPIASGKSAAFHGQAVAAKMPYPARSMTPTDSASDAALGMRALPPRLVEGVDDHDHRDGDEDQDDRAREPRRLVAGDRDIEVVLGDLAEYQAQHEGCAWPAGEHHEVSDGAEDQRHQDV